MTFLKSFDRVFLSAILLHLYQIFIILKIAPNLGSENSPNFGSVSHSGVSAAAFAAVSGVVPVCADVLGIHGASHREIWRIQRRMDGNETHRALPSVT
jgi:hypothetical protein